MQNHVEFMKQALSLAKEAAALGEVPVGAIVVKDGEIVGKGYNLRENNASATAHAEIIAIEEACRTLGTWSELINHSRIFCKTGLEMDLLFFK